MADKRKRGSGPSMLKLPPPKLNYLPRSSLFYRPAIGVIGCGSVSAFHLAAYQAAGYSVGALCDLDESRARQRRDAFFPEAAVCTDHHELLERDDIEVVDVTTPPESRGTVVEDALNAGMHVMTQVPFVTDLEAGERLVALAEEKRRRLAVNQNGRWAPHFSFMREAIQAGMLGEVVTAHFCFQSAAPCAACSWDAGQSEMSAIEDVRRCVLHEFGIHWLDILSSVMRKQEPRRVHASCTRGREPESEVHTMAQVMVEYDFGQASVRFEACAPYGAADHTAIVGTEGALTSTGPNPNDQTVTIYMAAGYTNPVLEGDWFTNGFQGTMAELLCAIEEDREPSNSARNNLRSLALYFAALASARDHEPKVPGEIRTMEIADCGLRIAD